ncbi:MAG: hypothetical protein HQL27_00180 [Candidatus Omnitrophica bacterium]|nr:hypothetical protein [Candidatus Omnitrophota bacterium]
MTGLISIKENDYYKLIITGSIFTLFLAFYFGYSITKFKSLKERSLVKNNVVMKVIQHNVNSVCPRCGTKGLPLCPTCKVQMYWNGYSGTFVCTACGQGGFPSCPRCNEFMTWIESR